RERVEGQLERLTAEQLPARVAGFAFGNRATRTETTQGVLHRTSALDRVDVALVGAATCRVGSDRDCSDREEGRAVDGADRRALVRHCNELLSAPQAVRVGHVVGDLGDAL